MSEQELIELLADMEHASWARWQCYLFSKCERQLDGSMTIPVGLVVHWMRQANTPYTELSEHEKESDRAEVAHILPIIKEYIACNYPPSMDEWKETVLRLIQQLKPEE